MSGMDAKMFSFASDWVWWMPGARYGQMSPPNCLDHEIHETCDSVTFYFMKKTHFLILAGSEFLHEMKRDGITSFMDYLL